MTGKGSRSSRSTSQEAFDFTSAVQLVTGLSNLAAVLLLLHESATGVSRTDILQDLAARFAQA
jgi:hypothetical protein